ncbi:unnamed protein product, partial [Ectocarpus sp. 12 AP-2014]
AIINVTTTQDVIDANDGLTSLREAVIQANGAGEPVTIVLPESSSSLSGAVTLSRWNANRSQFSGDEQDASIGDLDITGDILIRGTNDGPAFIVNSMGIRAF